MIWPFRKGRSPLHPTLTIQVLRDRVRVECELPDMRKYTAEQASDCLNELAVVVNAFGKNPNCLAMFQSAISREADRSGMTGAARHVLSQINVMRDDNAGNSPAIPASRTFSYGDD